MYIYMGGVVVALIGDAREGDTGRRSYLPVFPRIADVVARVDVALVHDHVDQFVHVYARATGPRVEAFSLGARCVRRHVEL